jgi:phage terminase large subunit
VDQAAPELWGLDCARYGSDASCLVKRRGYVVTEPPRRWRNIDTMQLAGAVKAEFDLAGENKPRLIVIDSIGIGAGVVDRLHEQGLPVLGLNVGEQSSTKERFVRLRDELWVRVKEWLATRRVRLPRDEQLRDDLVAPRFTFTSDGKIQIESKERMRSRGIPSPDAADALCMSLCEQGLMTTSEGQSGLFDEHPVMGVIMGTEV